MNKDLACTQITNEKPSAWTGHRYFAKWLVETLRPEITVDLGVDYGHSTFYLASANIGTVYGVDTFAAINDYSEHADNYLYVTNTKEKFNFDNAIFIKGFFDDIAKTWDKQIDILHIDGDHAYESVKNDYETWKGFLKENSVIMFHDTESYKDTVGRFFQELEMPHKLNFHHSAGLGVASNDPAIIELIRKTFSI